MNTPTPINQELPSQPVATPQTPPALQSEQPENLPKANKPFNPLLLVVSALLLLALGAAGWYQYLQSAAPQPTPAVPQVSPAAIPSASPVASQKPTSTPSPDSFQSLLINNCENVDVGPNARANMIDVEQAPITIDSNLITVKFNQPNKFYCMLNTETQVTTAYFDVRLVDDTIVNVYDQYSQELGHGGAPYLGTFGTTIKDDGDIKLTIFRLGSDGPQIISETRVLMRGEKRLTMPNGDTFYANYTLTAIEKSDPRLVEFLTPFSTPSEYVPGENELSGSPTNEQIKDKFFSNLSNLGPSEKSAMAEIERVLGAISEK